MHKPMVRVLPFEVPVLQAKHGPDKVFEIEDAELMIREFEPSLQYATLARKYGSDSGGNSWVQNVYGQEFEGRLEKAMQRSADLVKKEKPVNGDTHSNKNTS